MALVNGFGEPIFHRRFKKELSCLLNIYPNINYSIQEANQPIILKIIINNIMVTIYFDSYYPFKPPNKILLNNISYKKYLGFSINRQCLCCSSITCSNNWSPGLTTEILIKEIERNIYLKQQRTYLLLVKIIKNKYLNQDIPIEKWL